MATLSTQDQSIDSTRINTKPNVKKNAAGYRTKLLKKIIPTKSRQYS